MTYNKLTYLILLVIHFVSLFLKKIPMINYIIMNTLNKNLCPHMWLLTRDRILEVTLLSQGECTAKGSWYLPANHPCERLHQFIFPETTYDRAHFKVVSPAP